MTIAKYSLFVIIILILIFPLYWMISGSFMDTAGIMHMPPLLLPQNPGLKNYEILIHGAPNTGRDKYFFNWVANSSVLIVMSVILTIAITLPAGYTFSVYKFKGRNVIFWLFMSAMMISSFILIVPNFVLISKLKIPLRLAAILPSSFSPMFIFLTKNFIDRIPRSLFEVAELEGAGETRKIFMVALPLCGPLIGVMALFQGVGIFQDFLWQMLLFHPEARQTLPVGLILRTRQLLYGVDPIGIKLAAGTILFSVMFVIFCFTSKYFTKGLNLQGVKE